MIVIFILVWSSIIVSLFVIQRENKKRENALVFRVEQLESEVERIKKDASVNDKIKKMNKISMELLLILQEKENDIKSLLNEVDLIRKQGVRSPDLRVFDKRSESFKDDVFDEDLSLSEQHILEVLRKKRRAV